ncbi:MAG: 4-alpha-glucanotransferase [Actinomycetia bacterium]|nr:4-alpha-glucanotransferase [Actinomycetes bacterium]
MTFTDHAAPSSALVDLAHAYGVATEYHGWKGEQVAISQETLCAVLSALGADVSGADAIEASLIAVRERPWRQVLPPTIVCREDDGPWVPVHVPHGTGLECTIELESGEIWNASLADRWVDPCEIDGKLIGEATVVVPSNVPLGWHTLTARLEDGSTHTASLIVTPRTLPLHPSIQHSRVWGLMSQIYAARSEQSWGIGDLADLAETASWAGDELGADFVLVNPLHAAQPEPPMEASPYLPATRRFASPLYLRIEDIAELSGLSDAQRARIERLAERARASSTELINRDPIWEAKGEALAMLFSVPRSPRRQRQFDRYVRSEGQGLVDFATWSALVEEHGMPWQRWPEELHDPRSEAVAAFREEQWESVEFHMWLQWQIRLQLQTAQQEATGAGMSVGVIHDLAVGVHPDGADSWALRDALVHPVSVGAPPDQFNQLGQDWSQPPWHPQRLAELAYAPYRDMLRTVLRDSGGIRIDHILGLFRLWWVPRGKTPKDGTYVAYDSDAFIGILALEAQRAGAIVIGEDLGVVAPTLRETMLERGIHGTSILWFEWRDDQLLAPEQYRALCMASVTTHDLPPSAGYLTLAHVDLRDDLGLLERPVEEEKAAEAESIGTVVQAAVARGLLPEGTDISPDSSQEEVDDAVVALHAYLGQSPAKIIGVALPDLAGDRRAVNQPGTDKEYPNWRVPVSDPYGQPVILEQIEAGELAQRIAAVLNAT